MKLGHEDDVVNHEHRCSGCSRFLPLRGCLYFGPAVAVVTKSMIYNNYSMSPRWI